VIGWLANLTLSFLSVLGIVAYWYFLVYSVIMFAIVHGNLGVDILIGLVEIILIPMGLEVTLILGTVAGASMMGVIE
jgi:hypothetical protein